MFLNAAHLLSDSFIGRPLASSAGWGVVLSRPVAAAHDAGPRVCIPSREAIRSFQHATDVYKPSVVGGYPHVVVS